MNHCKNIDCKGKLAAIIVCSLSLAACDERLPPSSPLRPHTMAEKYRTDIKKAVFKYDLPCVQTVHPVAPNAATNCEWQASGGMNHGQVALSN